MSPVGNKDRQWLDLRHDVTVADIELSVRENFSAVEHIKRYTTLGMSVDQGKLGQGPAAEVIAHTRGLRPSELGHTTLCPPFVPVTLGRRRSTISSGTCCVTYAVTSCGVGRRLDSRSEVLG